LSATYTPVRFMFGARRGRGSGCACFCSHWSVRWESCHFSDGCGDALAGVAAPGSVLLYLLIVIPIAQVTDSGRRLLCRCRGVGAELLHHAGFHATWRQTRPTRHPGGICSRGAHGEPAVRAVTEHAGGRVARRADERLVRVHAADAADEPARGTGTELAELVHEIFQLEAVVVFDADLHEVYQADVA